MSDKKPVGRPAPRGRKIPVGIRLTPDVREFCVATGNVSETIEAAVRGTAEFRRWVESRWHSDCKP